MAASNHIKKKCLGLGPSSIGSKRSNVGGDVIDDIAKQKLDFLPDVMLEKIEDYLKDRFPEVYNNTLDKIISIPEDYDYGVETAQGKKAIWKARAMQYSDETEAEKRIAELELRTTTSGVIKGRRLLDSKNMKLKLLKYSFTFQ